MRAKIKTDYRLLNDYRLCKKARYILRCTTVNATSQISAATFIKLESATNSFINAIDKSKSVKASLLTTSKTQKRNKLVKLLDWLGWHIDFVTDNNHEIILSSGFDLNGPPRVSLRKPKLFRITVKGKGKVEASCRKVFGAYRYHYEFRASGKLDWESAGHGPNRIHITGLKTGVQYEFRVRPIDARREGDYSGVVTQYIC